MICRVGLLGKIWQWCFYYHQFNDTKHKFYEISVSKSIQLKMKSEDYCIFCMQARIKHSEYCKQVKSKFGFSTRLKFNDIKYLSC